MPLLLIFIFAVCLAFFWLYFCRIRLVAVATQKFVAEVATDALQQCKARQAAVVKDKRDKQQKDKRLILTMEDLSRALREVSHEVLYIISAFIANFSSLSVVIFFWYEI
ncbi:hypothetical protein I3760_15G087000 [Carya illinoinensis]|nr:hypothetical protein I3760_15G087000 [Carya illinoinensis]